MKKFEDFLNEEKTHNLTRYMNDDEIYNNLLIKSMNYLLIESTKINCFKGVKKAVEDGADVDTSNSEPLAWAVSKENNEMINYLIDNGAEINDKVFSIIYRKHNIDKIKLIDKYLENIHLGQFIKDYDRYFINFISYYGDIETFKYIVENYIEDDNGKRRLLNEIRPNALLNNIEIMDYVLKNGYVIQERKYLYTMDFNKRQPFGSFSDKEILLGGGKKVWNYDIKEIIQILEDEKKQISNNENN